MKKSTQEIIDLFLNRFSLNQELDLVELDGAKRTWSFVERKNIVKYLIGLEKLSIPKSLFRLRLSSNHDLNLDFYFDEESTVNERNQKAVEIIEKTLTGCSDPEAIIKGYKNGVHHWNWKAGNVRAQISSLIATHAVLASDEIAITKPNSAERSFGFTTNPGFKLDFDAFYEGQKKMTAKNAGTMVDAPKSSMKMRATATLKESFADLKDGAQTRTIHTIGGNLVTAMTNVIPSEEAKAFMSNEAVKVGTQAILAFLIKGMCDEGTIPAKISPYVREACRRQLQAVGYEGAGPILDQAVPLGKMLLEQLAEAGKALMTSEQVEEIENELKEAEVSQTRVSEEEIEVDVEEEDVAVARVAHA